MIEQLNEVFIQLNAFTKSNPVIAGVVSLWGLTIVTFAFRNVPLALFNLIKRQLTTTLTLNSQDQVYHYFLKWVSENNLHSFVRTLNFNNRWRGLFRCSLTIGYGFTVFFYKGRFFAMHRKEVEANQTEYSKEQINIILLGRDHEIFKDLFKEITHDPNEDQYTQIFSYKNNVWQVLCKQYKRPMNTVFINNDVKNNLFKHINNFIENKDWYRSNGIPYRTGILLEGPPGTGKTSIIKGLCAYYNKDLFLISLEHMSDDQLRQSLAEVPEGAIIAIEDIDSCGMNLNNRSKDSKSSIGADKDGFDIKTLTISGILNAIDGAASGEDRILIATTNHKETLDEALIREGRFDLHLHIGYMDNETFRDYFKNFYPSYELPANIKIKSDVSPAKVQKTMLDNFSNPENVISELTIHTSNNNSVNNLISEI